MVASCWFAKFLGDLVRFLDGSPLRAARGWTLEKTARIFLLDLHTLQLWMRRLDEQGDRALIQTVSPVNRYPDFVRHLVRQLRLLFPTMGVQRMAQVLARAGLQLGATTIRRILRERDLPPDIDPEPQVRPRRRVVARYPGHTWHVDLTVLPTRAGFWVPWSPFSLPQRWPFCWWIAVAVDQVSRALVGFAVFPHTPPSDQIQGFLDRCIQATGQAPRYVITDKGKQFWCRSFRRWGKRRGIRCRFGAIGQPASIAIVERFIRSMKQECLRRLLVPLSLAAVRREVRFYAAWYNAHRPHTSLAGMTPFEVLLGRKTSQRKIEPRVRWPHRRRRASPGGRLALDVGCVAGRKHLPVIRLRRAA